MRAVCVIAQWELDTLKNEGIHPDCRRHRHCKKSEAREMICFDEFRPYHQPIAEYVDERRIVLKRRFEWKKGMSDGYAVMQLVEA